jgi:hypothetical protein
MKTLLLTFTLLFGFTSCDNHIGTEGLAESISSEQQTPTTDTPENTAPTISDVANQTIEVNETTDALAITIFDVDSTLTCLESLSASSSNTTLIDSLQMTITGTSTNCTLTLAPKNNQHGSTTITLTVTDGELTATESFTLTVNSFSPDNFSGIHLWLDSDDNSTLFQNSTCTGVPDVNIGDGVGCWKDKSNNSTNFSNTAGVSAGTKPKLETGAIRFNSGINTDYLGASSYALPTSEFAIFLVTTTTDTNCGVLSYANDSQNNDFLLFSPNSLKIYMGGSNTSLGNNLATNDLFVVSGKKSIGKVNVFADGVGNAGNSYSAANWYNTSGTLLISQEQDSTGGGFDLQQTCSMELSEFIIYDREISAVEREKVEGYLACKWNFQSALPTDHTYKTNCP